jgi:hypothetical protein
VIPSWHRVGAAFGEWVAAAYPAGGVPAALEHAVFRDALDPVGATMRHELALPEQVRADVRLVKPNDEDRQPARRAHRDILPSRDASPSRVVFPSRDCKGAVLMIIARCTDGRSRSDCCRVGFRQRMMLTERRSFGCRESNGGMVLHGSQRFFRSLTVAARFFPLPHSRGSVLSAPSQSRLGTFRSFTVAARLVRSSAPLQSRLGWGLLLSLRPHFGSLVRLVLTAQSFQHVDGSLGVVLPPVGGGHHQLEQVLAG